MGSDVRSAPLSYGQQRLWFLHLLEGPGAAYNVPLMTRVAGPVDEEALRAAVDDVVERHEALRTVIGEGEDGPVQFVVPAGEVRGALHVTRRTPRETDADLLRLAAYPFDLTGELPFRADLIRTGEREYVLALVMHHIAVDGWSLGRLCKDLGRAYTARRAGRAPGFEPLEVQYGDFAVWQRSLLGDPDDPESLSHRQLAYWREALAGLPEEIALPADRPRPQRPGWRGGQVAVPVAAGVAEGVRRVARDAHATVFMVGQAALAVALTAAGAGEDLPIGTPVAGRGEPVLDGVVGFFVNTVVLRTDTSGDPAFTELLRRVRETDLAALEHQDLPFDHIVTQLAPGRSASRNPLFQVAYDIHFAEEPLRLEGTATATELGQEVPKFDLMVVYRDRGRDAEVLVSYSADLFDAGTARAFAGRVAGVLDEAVARPGTRVRAFGAGGGR